ncbi:MAG: carboxypeptidase-like regulatory domain-containing protein [Gemmatimonadaceae bacterium]
MFATFCVPHPTTVVPAGGVGTLVAVIVDSAGAPRVANAYIAEDPHVTIDVVTQGKAGTWADEKGIAHLGAWRPGTYTLVIRAVGYYQERRAVTLHSGQTDSVKVVVRALNMTSQ